jgi:hypothetical protein
MKKILVALLMCHCGAREPANDPMDKLATELMQGCGKELSVGVSVGELDEKYLGVCTRVLMSNGAEIRTITISPKVLDMTIDEQTTVMAHELGHCEASKPEGYGLMNPILEVRPAAQAQQELCELLKPTKPTFHEMLD